MICAEPLTHVAYGPCGHRDACVECVARLRFVMDDERCVICQVKCPSMFATRAIGDYTETISASGFAELPARAKSRELHHDKTLNMFFDDFEVYRKVEALRGLQCGECSSETNGGHQNFSSLKHLKQHLRQTHDKAFCDVCLEGRKVFVTQQLTYSRSQSDRHRHGKCPEIDAPELGGFKGHPSCKFCRGKQFYDEGVMYHHMQSAHETCHLCRRASPDTYTYFKDYNELEQHYNKAHHPCLHPECLAKKFVVFHSPQELKNHEGLEHGRQMTKTERKEALRLQVDFNVGRGFEENGSGGFGFGGEGGGRGGGHADSNHQASDAARRNEERLRVAQIASGGSDAERAQLEAVLRASVGAESHMPRPPSMEEFPDLGGGGDNRGVMQVGGWAGRAGGSTSRTRGGARGNVSGPAVQSTEDFPSLGGGVGRGGGIPPRNRQPAPMPDLPIRASEHLRQSFANMSSASQSGASHAHSGVSQTPPVATESNFPSLGGRLAGGASTTRIVPMNKASQVAAKREKDARRLAPSGGCNNGNFGPGGGAHASSGAQPGAAFTQVGTAKRGGRWNSWSLDVGSLNEGASGTQAKAPSKKALQQAEEDKEKQASASADLAARNDRLVASIRDSLTKHGALFEVFLNLSTQFKDGRINALGYLGKVTAMGIESGLTKELANLMPDKTRQQELFKAITVSERVKKKDANSGNSVSDAAALLFGGSNNSKDSTSTSQPWDCVSCTFRNDGSNVRCDVCDGVRGGSNNSGSGSSSGGGKPNAVGGKKNGKKGVKISLTGIGGVGVNSLDKFIPGKEKSAWGS